jgi:hypothetical protein
MVAVVTIWACRDGWWWLWLQDAQTKEKKRKKHLICFFFLLSVLGAACADVVGDVAGAVMGGLNKR